MLADGLKLGMQNLGVKLNIRDTLPDPTEQPPAFPVTWMPGSYEFRFHVCQGECGSKHPHSFAKTRDSDAPDDNTETAATAETAGTAETIQPPTKLT